MKPDNKLLYYVQMLDSALPIGSFSHSFGLETYVQKGVIRNLDDLEKYIAATLHASLAPFEGLAMKGMYTALEQKDWKTYVHYDELIFTQRTARESREAIHKMGKRLLKLVKTLYPWMQLAQLEEALSKQGYGTLPAIHTYTAHQLGIGLHETITGYLYTSVSMMVNSALRLMSMGQTQGQQLIQQSIPQIEQAWKEVSALPPEELHAHAWLQEIYEMNHETLYSRLFMS
ncbi:urease accessory protein UreF [Marinicrinis sediminis]|uniref:Urease accessory protein UreF n=1 Tax=Marinicrinis sediminis TaxID=1652465 RepID=A0ABW5R8A3_9BACL